MSEVGLRLHPEKRGSSIAKTVGAGQRTSTPRSPSSGTPSGHGGRAASTAEASPDSCLRSAPRRSRPKAPGSAAADPPAHRPVAGRPGEMAEPHHRRVDQLLRPVLPDRARSPPAAHQHLPEALGREKVQTTADPQELQQVVDRTAPTSARPIRPLENSPLLLLNGRSEEPGDGRLSRRDPREPGAAMPRRPDSFRTGSLASPLSANSECSYSRQGAVSM